MYKSTVFKVNKIVYTRIIFILYFNVNIQLYTKWKTNLPAVRID